MALPNQRNAGAVKFSDIRYANAKAMAVYAAYLFEKLVYGDNFPKTEYNRKLEVIKTLSAKEIEFVNNKVAGKLEKVYTILKELASDKPVGGEEPLARGNIEEYTDKSLEKIKQTSSTEDVTGSTEAASNSSEELVDPFSRPEV